MGKTDRYVVIDDSHGEGGFATISKGIDTELDRQIAIKKLRLFDDDDSKERFRREAKILAKMSHPNIPSIYDVRFKENEMKIIFEFIEGESLRKVINDEAYPSIGETISWFSQVASALKHAHSINIIHRDIKPENIIISRESKSAYLVDFGIALSPSDVERITSSGYVIGTRGYMSPEQENGQVLTVASDFYSLGITLYEALSGRRPIIGGEISLSKENEAIPPAIDTLIQDCIQNEPSRRISSAEYFITRLKDTVRTDMPLSELITEARLHELHAGLLKMDPDEFHRRPKGQRMAIITRLKDLLRTEKKELIGPAAEMLAILTRLCIYEDEAHYSYIIESGYEWGFSKYFGENWQGNINVRQAIIGAAKVKDKKIHNIIADHFLKLVTGINYEELDSWYIHDVRVLVKYLLANQHCDKYADKLADEYDTMNICSHKLPEREE